MAAMGRDLYSVVWLPTKEIIFLAGLTAVEKPSISAA